MYDTAELKIRRKKITVASEIAKQITTYATFSD